MPLQVSYMGTKRWIAPAVADLVCQSQNGPLLDLFSGMCAVGSAVAGHRQVWTNDAQVFSASVAQAYFTSADGPLVPDDAIDLTRPFFKRNLRELEQRYGLVARRERSALQSRDVEKIKLVGLSVPTIASSTRLEKQRQRLARRPRAFPFRLFTITYAGGYLGLEQCMQVDSIRYATERLLLDGQISTDRHRWLNLALAKAMCRCAATTGHFAQYLKIKASNKRRYIESRERSIWREWVSALHTLEPEGSRKWRSKNKSFNMDAVSLLRELTKERERPSLVYADPPYTKDQYSRYYHLYETLLLYDYPKISGIGAYRQDRFRSAFSIRSIVGKAFQDMIRLTAQMPSELILSYPSNGLLPNARETITDLLNRSFKRVSVSGEIEHMHSSLGGSSGKEKHSATELIFWAR